MSKADTTRDKNWLPLLIVAVAAGGVGLICGLAVGEFANSKFRQSFRERLTFLEQQLASAKDEKRQSDSSSKDEKNQSDSQRAEQQEEIERLRGQLAAIRKASAEGISPERVARLEDRIVELNEENETLHKKVQRPDESGRKSSDSTSAVVGQSSNSAGGGGRGGLTIANTTVKNEGFGITSVVGEVTNNASRRYSATLMATFYGKDGRIVGTASGAINNVEPGQTKTFQLMSTDKLGDAARYKVAVDTLVPF